MRRLGALALLALVLLAAAAAGGFVWVRSAAEDALASRGFTWARREGLVWHDLHRPGITVGSLALVLSPEPGAVARDISLDIAQLRDTARGDGDGDGGGVSLPGRVWAEDVTARWEGDVLAEGLSGEVWPALSLESPDSRVQRTPSGWSAALRRPLALEHLSGEALLTVEGEQELSLSLSMPQAVVSHPVLADKPLPAQPLSAALTWDRAGGGLAGTVSLGDVSAEIDGTLGVAPLSVDAEVVADAIALESVVALFGPLVPEGQRAALRGRFGLTATVSGPPVAWSAQVTADGLAAGGVASLESLKYGRFSWRAPAAGGAVQLRETGEGHRSWTPLRDGMLMAQAAIAAEDARFSAHPGYDIEGINAALVELAEGAERPRGGSTITQQLAKNLFLDGERTVARKLRELLYALEMERVLGKPRILELYINVVEFGPTLYGVRAGADAYFLKRPEGLLPQEAAFLASILPSPRSWYARLVAGRAPSTSAVHRIVWNMANTGHLSSEQARRATQAPLIVIPPPKN